MNTHLTGKSLNSRLPRQRAGDNAAPQVWCSALQWQSVWSACERPAWSRALLESAEAPLAASSGLSASMTLFPTSCAALIALISSGGGRLNSSIHWIITHTCRHMCALFSPKTQHASSSLEDILVIEMRVLSTAQGSTCRQSQLTPTTPPALLSLLKFDPLSLCSLSQASLNKLMETLGQSEPYFVKCIRSNAEKVELLPPDRSYLETHLTFSLILGLFLSLFTIFISSVASPFPSFHMLFSLPAAFEIQW